MMEQPNEDDDHEQNDPVWRGQSFEAARTFDRSLAGSSFAQRGQRQEQDTVWEEQCDEDVDAWKRGDPSSANRQILAADEEDPKTKGAVSCLPGAFCAIQTATWQRLLLLITRRNPKETKR